MSEQKSEASSDGARATGSVELVERISNEEMYRAVAGRAAMAEHDANAAQRCGLHGQQLEDMKRYAATLRAAANKFAL
jgi:hypothetical protein